VPEPHPFSREPERAGEAWTAEIRESSVYACPAGMAHLEDPPQSGLDESARDARTQEQRVVHADDILAGRRAGATAWRRVYPRRHWSDIARSLRVRLAGHPSLLKALAAMLALWAVVAVAAMLAGKHERNARTSASGRVEGYLPQRARTAPAARATVTLARTRLRTAHRVQANRRSRAGHPSAGDVPRMPFPQHAVQASTSEPPPQVSAQARGGPFSP